MIMSCFKLDTTMVGRFHECLQLHGVRALTAAAQDCSFWVALLGRSSRPGTTRGPTLILDRPGLQSRVLVLKRGVLETDDTENALANPFSRSASVVSHVLHGRSPVNT